MTSLTTSKHISRSIGIFAVILNLFLSLNFSSCTHHSDEVLAKDKDLLWKLAESSFQKGDWYSARLYYEKFQRFYPQSHNASIARLRLADAYYQEFKYGEAEVHYDNFIELHPTHPDVPYAWFQLALSQKRQVPDVMARDLSKAKDAMVSFQKYLSLPNMNPRMRPLAESHYQELETVLLHKELKIAGWYYKTGRYLSAFQRHEYALKHFGHLKEKMMEPLFEAVAHMGVSAIQLKDKNRLEKTKDILKDFTMHRRYQKTNNWIQSIKTESWKDQ